MIHKSPVKMLIGQYKLQERLIRTLLGEVSIEDSVKRIGDNINHISWQAGHLVFARYLLSASLGIDEQNPYYSLYQNWKPLDPALTYPKIDDALKNFNEITCKIMPRLENITQEELNAPLQFTIPIGDNTVSGIIAFLAHHEAYHIGQLSLLRRFLGYGPMDYGIF